MSDEQITIPVGDARMVLDALIERTGYQCGSIGLAHVRSMRVMAEALGMDPERVTPPWAAAEYVHPFNPETDRIALAVQLGASTQVTTGEGYSWFIHEDKMPDYIPCKAGDYGRRCMKPEGDPIHQGTVSPEVGGSGETVKRQERLPDGRWVHTYVTVPIDPNTVATTCKDCGGGIGLWGPPNIESGYTHIRPGGAPLWEFNKDHEVKPADYVPFPPGWL